MDLDALAATAIRAALEMPEAERAFPFGPEIEVYEVRGKIFMLLFDGRGVNLKCDPEHSRHLRDHFPSITPGYHMNKRHWITLGPGEGITADLVEELVWQSWELVVEKMPRGRRPAKPDWPQA